MGISDRVEQHVQNVQNVSDFGARFMLDTDKLLFALGYEKQPGDEWFLGLCMRQVRQEIQNACNVPEVPCGLYQTAIRLVVAQFLTAKKSMGDLKGFHLNFEAAIEQLQEGDTKVVWATDAGMNPEQRFDAFMALLQSGRSQFASYRRLKW